MNQHFKLPTFHVGIMCLVLVNSPTPKNRNYSLWCRTSPKMLFDCDDFLAMLAVFIYIWKKRLSSQKARRLRRLERKFQRQQLSCTLPCRVSEREQVGKNFKRTRSRALKKRTSWPNYEKVMQYCSRYSPFSRTSV